MLLGEQQELLFLHHWFGVELAWSERTVSETELNTADHHRWGRWQRCSAVYWERCDTEQIGLDRCSRSSGLQRRQMALDWRTTIRFVIPHYLRIFWTLRNENIIMSRDLVFCTEGSSSVYGVRWCNSYLRFIKAQQFSFCLSKLKKILIRKWCNFVVTCVLSKHQKWLNLCSFNLEVWPWQFLYYLHPIRHRV